MDDYVVTGEELEDLPGDGAAPREEDCSAGEAQRLLVLLAHRVLGQGRLQGGNLAGGGQATGHATCNRNAILAKLNDL